MEAALLDICRDLEHHQVEEGEGEGVAQDRRMAWAEVVVGVEERASW